MVVSSQAKRWVFTSPLWRSSWQGKKLALPPPTLCSKEYSMMEENVWPYPLWGKYIALNRPCLQSFSVVGRLSEWVTADVHLRKMIYFGLIIKIKEQTGFSCKVHTHTHNNLIWCDSVHLTESCEKGAQLVKGQGGLFSSTTPPCVQAEVMFNGESCISKQAPWGKMCFLQARVMLKHCKHAQGSGNTINAFTISVAVNWIPPLFLLPNRRPLKRQHLKQVSGITSTFWYRVILQWTFQRHGFASSFFLFLKNEKAINQCKFYSVRVNIVILKQRADYVTECRAKGFLSSTRRLFRHTIRSNTHQPCMASSC